MKTKLLFTTLFLCILVSNAQNLIAYYPFNGNANDETGNGNNSTYIGSGVTLTTDKSGEANRAFYFDGGVGSYIRIPADKFPTLDRTISFWFNADSFSNGPTPVSYGGNGCNSSCFLALLNRPTNNAYNVSGHCNESNIAAAYTSPPIAEWKHWVITINGTTQKIYINGLLKQTSTNYIGPTYVAGKSFVIGGLLYPDGTTVYVDAGGSGYFKGKLDEFRIYNNPMTDEQVLSLYNTESTGLVAYYPFNGNANDESGNENHGIVNGATLTNDRFGNASKAYSFTNPNHISVPNSNVFGDEFSVSYWFKINYFSGLRGVMSNVAIPNGGFQQAFDESTFSYILGYNFPLSSDPLWSNYTMQEAVDQWHHLVLTYKKTGTTSSESKLFINGDLKKTSTHSLSILFTPNTTFYIGQNHSGLNFQGDLDEIRIYNRMLSTTEITSLYTNNALKIENAENVATNNFYVSGNILYFNNTQNFNDIKTVEVYNLVGQKVFNTSKIKREISFIFLTKGVYILKIKDNDGKISSIKFLIDN